MEEAVYAYWLFMVPGIGSIAARKLAIAAGTARNLWHVQEKELRNLVERTERISKKEFVIKALLESRNKWNLERYYEDTIDNKKLQHCRFHYFGGPGYPWRLSQIPGAPYGFMSAGKTYDFEKPSVAVIGARNCSEYGRFLARETGIALAKSGFSVISGMARGIDGISQSAALGVDGHSVGVLGSGVDVCYPAENEELYRHLLEQGTVVSEYPLGTVPLTRNFPMRNRIISGLSNAVVVIEAREKSGTLITVDAALEQGREVYVYPGRVTDRLSDGCNRLIRQGAEPILSVQDLITELLCRSMSPAEAAKDSEQNNRSLQGDLGNCIHGGITCNEEAIYPGRFICKEEEEAVRYLVMTEQEKKIYQKLDFVPFTVGMVLELLGEVWTDGIGELSQILMGMCLKGYIGQKDGCYYKLSMQS